MPCDKPTLHPVSTREQRYERLWEEFRQFERVLPEEENTTLDGLLWSLSERITYGDELD